MTETYDIIKIEIINKRYTSWIQVKEHYVNWQSRLRLT